jgi:hypothetical protein
MKPLTPNQLSNYGVLLDRPLMLETLRAAYQFVRDEMDFPDGSRLLPDDPARRLDLNGQRELGRRLAAYALLAAEPSDGDPFWDSLIAMGHSKRVKVFDRRDGVADKA